MRKHLPSLAAFLSGLFLSLGCALLILLIIGGNTALFFRMEKKSVTGIDSSSLEAFSDSTMAYLRGEKETWDVFPAGITASESFALHMADVRQMYSVGKWLCAIFLVLGIAGAIPIIRNYPTVWRCGVCIFPGLLFLCGIWCLADFNGFWFALHRVLIPGGIFSSSEKIMLLFPSALFEGYLIPLLVPYGLMILLLWFLPNLPIRRKVNA